MSPSGSVEADESKVTASVALPEYTSALTPIVLFQNFRPELAGDLPEKCTILVESPMFIGLVVHFGGGIVEV